MVIYPAIDIKGGKCVRLVQGSFDAVTTYGDDPGEIAKRWLSKGAEWLHIVDLDGAKDGKPNPLNTAEVAKIAASTGLNIQYGGGIRSAESVSRMLSLGVSRVVVGTVVAKDAVLARELFDEFGEKLAVGVDARNGIVAVQGWQEHTGETALRYVERMAGLGATRFIFTDIGRDGMLEGVNIELLAQVAMTVPQIPVIASGGVATMKDIDALLLLRETATNVEGVIIGKALYAETVHLSEVIARSTAD